MKAVQSERFFKTAWFARAAKKAHIGDAELCSAIAQVLLGQADDLGGGVYKKRLAKNLYRSIVLAKGGQYWVYTYLFAKNVRANIDESDLKNLRALAATYALKTAEGLAKDLTIDEIEEICHDED